MQLPLMSNPPLGKDEFVALSEFRYQLRRFIHWSEQLTRKAGVTNLQYLLMLHIRGQKAQDWATITQLAERLQAKHHGTVALVTRCEKLGLVKRQPGRADRREVEVHLTAKGNRMVERLAGLHREELLRLRGILTVPGEDQLAPRRQART